MVNELVQRFLDHPHRTWIAWAAAVALCLVLVVPSWDESRRAHATATELQSQLLEMKHAVANRDLMQIKVVELKAQSSVTHEMVGRETAAQVRETVTSLVRETDCQMRRLTLGDPVTRPWQKDDNPFSSSPRGTHESSGYDLETRHLNLSVDGTLAKLSKLTIALTRINRFVVPTEMTLQRERENGQLRLDVNLSLFNLVDNND
ncbi:hypothetical protein [Planctomycetes bacterium K23_9]|uniref:Uncharacterized protein n=1 Tax=Stieleria marina TaxID=1930275 RepID=A0A517NWC5_9BACT|nr:hypothetical protein K239x_34210 [Planctomycetes bacterium K23_9]